MRLLTYKNIKYFQSDLLNKHNFIHFFFTKRYEKNTPIELQNELDLISTIHFLNQVHSNQIIQINNTLDLKPKMADCLITKERNKSLWIYTADCLPILIADIKTRNIAACHCGLNGLKNRIISKTLKKLIKIGSKKKNLIISIGPSIKGDKYQVDLKDVHNLIIQIIGKRNIGLSYPIIQGTNKQEGEVIKLFQEDPNPNKLLFDIKSAAILQFYKIGIKQSQININRLCTYSNPTLFNSFRRDNTTQRQWSCIYS